MRPRLCKGKKEKSGALFWHNLAGSTVLVGCGGSFLANSHVRLCYTAIPVGCKSEAYEQELKAY